MLDKYKLGIDIIDQQHAKLFEMIDELKSGNFEENDCGDIIKKLKKYSQEHFKTEEDYFNNINFINAEKHIQSHNMFIHTVDYYFNNIDKINKNKIFVFLNTWIKNHILIEDKEYTLKKNITYYDRVII